MKLNQAHGVIDRPPYVEGAVTCAGKRSENRRAGGIGIRRRADEGAHRSCGEWKQIGDHIRLMNTGDSRYALTLEKVGVVVVRRIIEWCRIAGATSRINDLPQRTLVQR